MIGEDHRRKAGLAFADAYAELRAAEIEVRVVTNPSSEARTKLRAIKARYRYLQDNWLRINGIVQGLPVPPPPGMS